MQGKKVSLIDILVALLYLDGVVGHRAMGTACGDTATSLTTGAGAVRAPFQRSLPQRNGSPHALTNCRRALGGEHFG